MTTPHIIRTVAELDALDHDTVLIPLHTGLARSYEVMSNDDLPAVIVATGEQVRAAREALEGRVGL